MPFQDDIDDFMAKRKSSAPKPVQPADDDVDSFMSKRQPALKSPSSPSVRVAHPRTDQHRAYTTNYDDGVTEATPESWGNKPLPTYEDWRKSGSKVVPPNFSKGAPSGQFKSPVSLDFRAPTETDKMIERAQVATGKVAPAPTSGATGRSAFQQIKPRRSALEQYQAEQAQQSFNRANTPQFVEPQTVTPQERAAASQKFIEQNAADKAARQLEAKARMEAEAARAPKNTLGKIGGHFVRGAVTGTATAPLRAAAMTDKTSLGRQVFSDAAQKVEDATAEYFPLDRTNPATLNVFKPEFYSPSNIGRAVTENIPEVVGQMLPAIALSRGAGAAAGLAAPELAGATALPRLMPAVTGAELASRTAAGAYGAMNQAQQAYQNAINAGFSHEDALRAAAMEAPIGATEFLGSPGTTGAVRPRTVIGREMREEGLQELGQNLGGDLMAKYGSGYGANKSLSDIAGEAIGSGALGAAVGGLGALPGAAREGRMARAENNAVRAERAPMQDIRPTMTGPTQVTPLTPKATRTAVAETATPVSAIDQTVPNTIDQTEPQIAAESPSAFPRLPEPKGFNARRAQMLGMELPAEVSINERLQKADKLASSQNENDQKLGKRMLKQTLADIQKSEGYLTEFDLPDDAPKPYTAVKNAIEAKLKPAPKAAGDQFAKPVSPDESTVKPSAPASTETSDTGQRLIEQTRLKADQAIAEGRFDDAVSELKAHQQALKDAKTAARKSPGMRTQIERQIGQVGNQIGEVRRMAREVRKQANAQTVGLAKRNENEQPLSGDKSIQDQQLNQKRIENETAPLLRPEAVQNPSGGIPQMPEQTFSGRLEQGIRRQEAQKPSAPAKRLIQRIKELGGIDSRHVGEMQSLKDARNVGVIRNGAKMSPDILARQLQSEGYDIDPENLDTLWAAIDRDVAGKNERPANTADLDRRLKEEEAAHYARQEEAGSEPSKSFDQIASEVEGDTDTAALRRSIARSEERGHVMPEPGRGLVSMSPYADMKARNAEAVDRLYEVGPATKEGREIINNLRKFNQQNGIESRHMGNLINDVKNFQMERARWKEQGLSLDTVQQALDSETTLKDRVREATAKLPDNRRTAIEREVAALDELYDDADAMNLLDRIVEGDNNAVNEFKQKAGEYGLEPDTIAELVGARESERTIRQAEIAKARAKNERTQTPAQESREARSATPDEFDLLNRNPATIPKDEFDQHLLAVEKLRNDEIRGIVKLPRDDRRQMYKHLRNLNEERKFRVKRGELPAKYERLPVPTMEERRAMWAKGDQWNAPSASKARSQEFAPESNYWNTPRVENAPTTQEEGQKVVADSRVEFRQSKRGTGTLWTNHQAAIVIASAANQTGADLGAIGGFAGISMSHRTTSMTADLLREKASEYGADGKRLNEIADALEAAQSDAIAHGRDDIVIADSTSADNLSEAKRLLREERFHSWQRTAGLFDRNVSRAMDATLGRNPIYRRIKEVLLEEGYSDNPRILSTEAAAKAASGQWERYGLKSEDEALDFLNDYYKASARMLGVDALMENAPATPRARRIQENVRNEERVRPGNGIQPTETARGRGEQGSVNAPSVGRRNESGRDRRSQEENASGLSRGKRSSFGELENEPRGQVLASGFNIQDLFNRKKEAKPEPNIELPKDWDAKKWAKKTYTDALVNALPPKVRAEYGAAKTEKEKLMILMSNADPDVEAKIFKLVDEVADALDKGDGNRVAKARDEARKLLSSQVSPSDRDVKWYDHFTSRLSNVNYKGTYERIAGQQGKEISEIFRNAQVDAANGKITRSEAVKRMNQELKPYTRRLKAAGKPGLARWIETHIDAVSDPDQSFRGLAGFLKGFQYNTKLRLNPRSALVNSLQPLQTLWPHLTTREWAKLQIEAAKPATWRRIAETAARESGGSIENVNDKKKFMGWADLFTPVSEYNRIVGHLAGELFADRNGLTGDAKARMAADWAKKVEFDNSAYDIPPLFSGKIAGVVGQFKPFMVKNIERIVSDWKSAPPEALATNSWKGAGTIARRAKMIAAQVAIGGVRSAVPGLKTIGGVLILGALAKSFGKFMDDDKAEKLAEAVYFGAPALVEQDLSGSVAVFDEPFGKTAYEKLVNFGGGPTLSLIAKAYEEGKNINEAEDSKKQTKGEKQKAAALRLAKAVTPYMKFGQAAYSAFNGETPKMWMGKEVPMTKTEAVGSALLGTPLRQSKFYENKEAFDWQKKLMPDRFPKEDEKATESKKTRVTDTGKIETSMPKQKPNEPEEIYNKRVERVNQWMDTYGQKLIDSPRYKSLSDEEKQAALKTLRARIGRQQNAVKPNEKSFEPNAVLLGVKKSARERPRKDAKKLWVAPPK